LTPVLVGGGEEARLSPESYALLDDDLVVFSPTQVLRALPEAQRRELVAALSHDPLGGLRRLRARVDQASVIESIGLSPESRRELSRALEPARDRGQQGGGEVTAFQRAGGRPLIPGSTVKGALRTAWLARESASITAAAIGSGPSGARSEALFRRAFDTPTGKDATDHDPLRDVVVADACIPEGATRIDPVATWKKTAGEWGFGSVGQMHWERLRSVVDGGAPPVVDVGIGVRTASVRRERRTHAPARSPESVATLMAALETHHAPLWTREIDEKFFAGANGVRLRAALALFDHLRRDGPDPDAVLIRIGRAGHAESKSVARFREVHRPQARTAQGRRAPEGSTRHVVRIGEVPAPFGWMLAVRRERWRPPTVWLEASASGRRTVASSGEASVARRLPLYRKGQSVRVGGDSAIVLEDVTEGASHVRLDFSGDHEHVPIEDIDP
jgi:CRISPR-associated protein Csm5